MPCERLQPIRSDIHPVAQQFQQGAQCLPAIAVIFDNQDMARR